MTTQELYSWYQRQLQSLQRTMKSLNSQIDFMDWDVFISTLDRRIDAQKSDCTEEFFEIGCG